MLVSELISACRSLLDEPSNSLLTDDEFISYINLSLPEVASLAVKAGHPYYLKETTITKTDGKYLLPDDFWVVVALLYLYPPTLSGVKIELHPKDDILYKSSFMWNIYQPPTFRLVGNEIKLYPDPLSDVELTLYYHRKPNTVSAVSDSVDVPSELEKLTVFNVTILAAVKASYSTAELEQMKLLEERKVKGLLSINAPKWVKKSYNL